MSGTDQSKFEKNPPMKTQKLYTGNLVLLRILTVSTTLASTWVMLAAKQSREIFGMTFVAQYSFSPAFKFSAFANAVACALSLLSLFLFLFLCRQLSKSAKYFFFFLHDLLMTLLVLAGCVAATAIGYVGKHGNKHTGWVAVCDQFGKFCQEITSSLILSYLSVLSLLALTIISASKSRQIPV